MKISRTITPSDLDWQQLWNLDMFVARDNGMSFVTNSRQDYFEVKFRGEPEVEVVGMAMMIELINDFKL